MEKATSFVELILFLIFAIPSALNIKALGKKKAEVELTKADQAPIQEESHPGLDVRADVSSPDISAPPSPPSLSSNYFVRHWRGDLSLGISYWLNGTILSTFLVVSLNAVVDQMSKGSSSLRAISFAVIGAMLFGVMVWLWSIVGIWRSANYHVDRGGASGWASAAKIMVVLGIIVMAGQLSANILPQIKEFSLIATGNDPMGNIDIRVSANGQSVIVSGMLGERAAAEAQKILDATPSATSLMLNSNGGRLLEAERLAHLVQKRNLNTYVEDECSSACTYIFLAGKDRAATPNALIGFHQPSFPGLDPETQRAMTQDMMNFYNNAGVTLDFIARIRKTPPEDMWYPTRDELIASNVITRVSLGREGAKISALEMRSKQELLLEMRSIPIFQSIEKRFPETINVAVELGWEAVERGGSDAEINNSMRSVIAKIWPKLLKTADGSTLDGYLNMVIKQMSAAHAISGEACAMLLATKLDITKTLPKEIVAQEQQFLLRALESPPGTTLNPPDPDQVDQAMEAVFVGMTTQQLNVLADMEAFANQPDLVCETTIAFYSGITALPEPERHVALRGMLQGEN